MFDERDVLLKAAERISEEGMWCRGSWYRWADLPAEARLVGGLFDTAEAMQRLGVRVAECLEGAVVSAAFALADNRDHARELADAAMDRLAAAGVSTIEFNDRVAGSAHEVADAMRQAAL